MFSGTASLLAYIPNGGYGVPNRQLIKLSTHLKIFHSDGDFFLSLRSQPKDVVVTREGL